MAWGKIANLKGLQGPQGMQGPPTPATTLHFRYQQLNPAATWTITHNLGYRPGGIRLYDSTGDEIIGDVSDVDDNTIVISFYSAVSGHAELS